MVLEADRHGVVAEVLVLAAALSIQDPRERPTGEEEAAAAHHRRFADPDSDFLAYLNLWRYLRAQQKELGLERLPTDVQERAPPPPPHPRVAGRPQPAPPGRPRHRARGRGRSPRSPTERRIHRALLAGLLSHVGMLDPDGNEYRGAREARFVLAPGTGARASGARSG